MADRFRRTSSPWATLAARALRASAQSKQAEAHHYLNQIAREHGPDVIPRVLLSMIDTVMARDGITHGTAVRIAFREDGTSAVQSADEVSPAVRWAGQFMGARVANDQAQAQALLRVATQSEQQWHECIAAVVNVCGTMIRHSEASRG